MLGAGLRLGHAEEAHVHARALIAPGRVDVIGLAVELRDGPDVVGVHKRGALDALEPQQKVVCSRVAVADGHAVHQRAVRQMTQRTAGDSPLIVDTVVAQPDVVGPRQLILCHVARQIAALPQRVVDEDRAGERLLTVFFELRAVTGCRGEGQQHLAGGIAAAGRCMLIARTFKSSLLQRWSAHLWQNGMTQAPV